MSGTSSHAVETPVRSLHNNVRLTSDIDIGRHKMLATFDERMPPAARWTRPDGGCFV
jgi:hypothetical protein